MNYRNISVSAAEERGRIGLMIKNEHSRLVNDLNSKSMILLFMYLFIFYKYDILIYAYHEIK